MTETRQKGVRKVNETRIKVREKNVDHHGYIEWIEKFNFGNLLAEDRRTTKNERRTMKNGWKSSQNHPRKRYGSASAWIFFTETILLTNFKWLQSAKRAEPFSSSLIPLLLGLWGLGEPSFPPTACKSAILPYLPRTLWAAPNPWAAEVTFLPWGRFPCRVIPRDEIDICHFRLRHERPCMLPAATGRWIV